jgi:formylglycine-generating enzyme
MHGRTSLWLLSTLAVCACGLESKGLLSVESEVSDGGPTADARVPPDGNGGSDATTYDVRGPGDGASDRADGGASEVAENDAVWSRDDQAAVEANAADQGSEGTSDMPSDAEAGAVEAPSCNSAGPGLTDCATPSESCCASLLVPGGTFSRAYTNGGSGATGLANPATVSSYRLDKYDVTVGRFRRFVRAVNAGYLPPAGAGKHAHLNGGLGLSNSANPGTYETGWLAPDGIEVAPTPANLACDARIATWTDAPGGNETLPITCVHWYEAYAFCIWDSGFLPSEAEWEYAAAGGAEQREYPWGSADPGTSSRYAIYGCLYPNGSGTCGGLASIAPVGTPALGAGLWGQLDLAGEVYEWNLDAFADAYVDPCVDCVNESAALPTRVRRGGAFGYSAATMQSFMRKDLAPAGRDGNFGFRCARAP